MPTAMSRLRTGAGRIRPAADRVRAATDRIPPAAVLALLVVGASIFLYVWARRTATSQLDEQEYVYLGRWLSHNLPGGLWNFTLFDRGLQRLEVYVLALSLGTLRSIPGFELAHAINAVAFATTCIPVYLLVRGLGARAAWALIAALLGVAAPWIVFATPLLTEPLGYPAWMWAIWAMWRAVCEPRAATQVAALLVLLVAALSRSAFVALAPVLPLAVLVNAVRFGQGPPRERAVRLMRENRVVVAVVAAALAGLALSAVGVLPPVRRLAGSYGTPFSLDWGAFGHKVAFWMSRVVAGSGFVPFAVGLPWLVRELIRPRSERSHAFAFVTLTASVLLLYASNNAGLDERYAIYYTPPLVVATAVALARRDLHPAWVVAGGALGAWLLHHEAWPQRGEGFSYFTAPAESFYSRVGLLKLSVHLPSSISPQTGALLIALAVSAVVAYGFSRRPGAAAALGVAIVALAGVQLAQADYAITKYVNGPGQRYGPSAKDRAFVDESIPGGADAGILAVGLGDYGLFDYFWRDVQFWNSSVTSQFTMKTWGISLIPGDAVGTIAARPADGRVTAKPITLPRYLVVPRGYYVEASFAGTVLRQSSYLPVDLVQRAEPAQLRFRMFGTAAQDGSLQSDAPSSLRVYSAGLAPGACVRIPVTGPPAGAGVRSMRLAIGRRRIVLAPEAKVEVTLPLELAGRPYLDFAVTLTGPRQQHPSVGYISVERCS